MATNNKLDSVHPELKRRVLILMANLAAKGLDVRVVQGLRSYAEQNALYAQGRTKPGDIVTNAIGGQSNHNFGLAVDLCPFVGGKPDWNFTKGFQVIGAEAKAVGLEWGGDWHFQDKPHVQLKGMSIKACQYFYNAGNLESVWNEMNRILNGDSPTVGTPKADDLLEFGDKGDEVRKLQLQLVKLNLMREHEVDGDFGAITKNAVIAFQRLNNLTADGIVGPGTKTKLFQ